MAINYKTKSFGEQIRQLREESGLTLKFVSEKLNIDISLLAKIERNERNPTKQLIEDVALFFDLSAHDLKNNFLSDQIAYKILSENADLSILKVAEAKVKYFKTVQNGERN